IKNNTIGSKLVNYSLVSTNGGVVLGVSADSAIYTEISNNTITNLSNLPYKESYLTAGILSSCKSLITKNKIYNLFSIGVKDASAIGTINGIFISRKYEKDTVNVSENEISGLTGSFQVGVCINDVQSSFVKVSKNSIHNFGRTESAGIYNINSSALIDNNMIALGYDTSGVKIFEGISLFGILTESSLKDEIYFNSVYIGGDSVHNSFSDKTSYAIKINNTAKDIIANNIFFNARSNNTDNGTLRHGAICIVNKKAMLQQNNLYYSNGTGGFLGSVNSKHLRGDISSSNQHLSAYLDEHFVLANPNFKYPAGNRYTTDLHLKDSTTIERMGIVLNTIPYDFDDKVRQNLTPTDIGAHAGNFKLLPKPKAIFTPGDICIGDSLKLNEASTLAISWFWSFGDGNFSWQKNPKHVYKNGGNYPVKLVVKSKYGLADTLVKNVLVDSSCVWPGDANADKIVDQRDILSIGIAYSETGNSRNDTTTTWTGHFAKNWNQNFLNTANFKHADSDGNGTITARDTTAITRNYSKTHNKNFNTTRGKNTDPVLKVEIQNTVIKAGDVLVAYIVLGENALPAKDVYGVALSLEYNHDYFNKPVVSFTNSWLGNNQLTYYNSTNGLDIALTRTDHNNISGSGRLAEIRMKIKDNAQFSQKQLNIEIGNTMIISADEKPVPVRIISDSVLVEGVSIDNKFDDNRSNNLVSIYPNPFYGQTTIAYNLTTNSKVSVTLCDINGKTIQIKPAKQEVAGEYQFVLDADKYNLTSGVYLLKIDLDGLPVYKRIVKVD
ncbi:MAG: PKD domain-containing protein, partial [Bacteroidia bacterium]